MNRFTVTIPLLLITLILPVGCETKHSSALDAAKSFTQAMISNDLTTITRLDHANNKELSPEQLVLSAKQKQYSKHMIGEFFFEQLDTSRIIVQGPETIGNGIMEFADENSEYYFTGFEQKNEQEISKAKDAINVVNEMTGKRTWQEAQLLAQQHTVNSSQSRQESLISLIRSHLNREIEGRVNGHSVKIKFEKYYDQANYVIGQIDWESSINQVEGYISGGVFTFRETQYLVDKSGRHMIGAVYVVIPDDAGKMVGIWRNDVTRDDLVGDNGTIWFKL